LERLKTSYGGGAAIAKREALASLEKCRLARPSQVLRLHGVCFLRAYPDDLLLSQVERMLEGFDRRPDLESHRRALVGSGIAGTPIHFRFFAPVALRLARRWGDRLTIDWRTFEHQDLLDMLLPLLALYAETPGLDECAFSAPVDRRMKVGRDRAAFW
jgi:hypothetical protein